MQLGIGYAHMNDIAWMKRIAFFSWTDLRHVDDGLYSTLLARSRLGSIYFSQRANDVILRR